jgi:hypothetical protein
MDVETELDRLLAEIRGVKTNRTKEETAEEETEGEVEEKEEEKKEEEATKGKTNKQRVANQQVIQQTQPQFDVNHFILEGKIRFLNDPFIPRQVKDWWYQEIEYFAKLQLETDLKTQGFPRYPSFYDYLKAIYPKYIELQRERGIRAKRTPIITETDIKREEYTVDDYYNDWVNTMVKDVKVQGVSLEVAAPTEDGTTEPVLLMGEKEKPNTTVDKLKLRWNPQNIKIFNVKR